jgi:hypothetical protein
MDRPRGAKFRGRARIAQIGVERASWHRVHVSGFAVTRRRRMKSD